MRENGKHRALYAAAFLTGGVLGSVTGLLLAPKSGKRLRADIRYKSGEIIKDAEEIYEDTVAKTKQVFDKAKRKIEEIRA
jgi:gas vesicle protein